VTAGVVSVMVGVGAALVILLAGGIDVEVALLAIVTGVAFADLARRAAREHAVASSDPTDLATSLGFLAILIAAAFDVGRADGRYGVAWVARGAGLSIITAGVALRALAVRALGRSFGVRLGVREDQSLVFEGPYRWIRHPNYTGLILVACGTAVSLSSPLALAAAIFLWLPILLLRIAREERMMIERFGQPYSVYMSRTWRLIVGIY
jgi:protein-S-isoprenylcysteine O-methyltransferase Ste14